MPRLPTTRTPANQHGCARRWGHGAGDSLSWPRWTELILRKALRAPPPPPSSVSAAAGAAGPDQQQPGQRPAARQQGDAGTEGGGHMAGEQEVQHEQREPGAPRLAFTNGAARGTTSVFM